MARLDYVDPENASLGVRDAMRRVPPLNIVRLLAHAETAFKPLMDLTLVTFSALELDDRLRELTILQVAKQSGAHYEWVQHVEMGARAGLTPEQIETVRDGTFATSSVLSEIERAVLEFSAEVVSGTAVSDEKFGAIRDVLSDREIVELLVVIGCYLTLARVMTTLEIDDDAPLSEETLSRVREQTAGRSVN